MSDGDRRGRTWAVWLTEVCRTVATRLNRIFVELLQDLITELLLLCRCTNQAIELCHRHKYLQIHFIERKCFKIAFCVSCIHVHKRRRDTSNYQTGETIVKESK